MSPEQLEGYLHRLELKFEHTVGEGPDGAFFIGLKTRRYHASLPPRDKQVRLVVSIHNGGEFLSITAPFLYNATEASDPAALYACLLDINFTVDGIHFKVDSRDGEVRCGASIPIKDSNLSLEAFKKVLYAIPVTIDSYDSRIRKCLRKPAKKPRPRPPAPARETAPLAEAVNRLTKVVEALVDKRRASRTRPSKPSRPAAQGRKKDGTETGGEGHGANGISA